MLVVSYKTKGRATKDSIKACDDGAKAMKGLLMATAKVIGANWITRAILWVTASVYRRVITDEEVRYEFFLFPNLDKSFNLEGKENKGGKNAVQPMAKSRPKA